MESKETQYEDAENYNVYLKENKRRDMELIEFVNDFLHSHEMTLLLKLLAPHKSKTCQPKTKEKSSKQKEPSLTLIEKMNEVRLLEQRLEIYAKQEMIKGITKEQDKSIASIREQIRESKKRYFCHLEERAEIELQRKRDALEKLKDVYHIDTTLISIKSPLVTKVLAYNKIRHAQVLGQRQRRMDMLRKILNEYKRQKQIDKAKNKRYDTKINKRKEKIFKDFEVVGTQIIVQEEEAEEESEKEESGLALLGVSPLEEKPKTEPPKVVQNKDEQGKDNKEKPSKEKPEKDTKKEQKGKVEPAEPELILPYVPITNTRQRVSFAEKSEALGLIKEVRAITKIQKDRKKYLKEKALLEEMPYPIDVSFSWKPKVLEFQGFYNNVVYKKKLRILNGGTCELKCRFHLVRLDEYHPCLIEVEPLGAQVVLPGQAFWISLKFKPEELKGVVAGKLIFLTYNASRCAYKYFDVPIKCIPACSHVAITPSTVKFPTLPIWEAKKLSKDNNYKHLNIANSGKKDCRVTISRIKRALEGGPGEPNTMEKEKILPKEAKKPLKYDEEEGECDEWSVLMGEEEVQLMAEEDVVDCIDTIFTPFRFETYCFDLPGRSEISLKIYFKNVDYVGYYNDKYLIEIYEKFEETYLKCVGCHVSEKTSIQSNL